MSESTQNPPEPVMTPVPDQSGPSPAERAALARMAKAAGKVASATLARLPEHVRAVVGPMLADGRVRCQVSMVVAQARALFAQVSLIREADDVEILAYQVVLDGAPVAQDGQAQAGRPN